MPGFGRAHRSREAMPRVKQLTMTELESKIELWKVYQSKCMPGDSSYRHWSKLLRIYRTERMERLLKAN